MYRGAPYQRGHGVGSFLGGLFRTIAPILRSGASTIGREALRSGVGFLSDVATTSTDPREAAGMRFRDFSSALKRKTDEKIERVLRGGGVGQRFKKRRITRVTPQSLTKLLRARSHRRSGKAKKRTRTTKKRTRTTKKQTRTLKKRTGVTKKTRRVQNRKRRKLIKDIFD